MSVNQFETLIQLIYCLNFLRYWTKIFAFCIIRKRRKTLHPCASMWNALSLSLVWNMAGPSKFDALKCGLRTHQVFKSERKCKASCIKSAPAAITPISRALKICFLHIFPEPLCFETPNPCATLHIMFQGLPVNVNMWGGWGLVCWWVQSTGYSTHRGSIQTRSCLRWADCSGCALTQSLHSSCVQKSRKGSREYYRGDPFVLSGEPLLQCWQDTHQNTLQSTATHPPSSKRWPS